MTKLKEKQKIPEGWDVKPLGEISKVTNGSTNTQDAVAGGAYPLFDRSVDIKRSDKFIFDDAAIILPGEGADFVPRYYKGKFDLHQRAYAIFSESFIDSRYLFQYLYCNRNEFVKKSVGSTVRSLRLPLIQSVEVTFPKSKTEQQKIAGILEAVDADIEETKSVIKATEKLKKGLMQELFTRGIGHTKFKQSDLGEIPESWEVVNVRNSTIQLIDGDRGTNYPKQHDFTPEGYCLFLSAKNVTRNGFVFNDCNFISKEKDTQLRKGKLTRGDIVLTSRGTVGNIAFFNESVPYDNVRINSGMLIVRHGMQFLPEFLFWYMTGPQMQSHFIQKGSGSAQPQLPVGSLELIPVPVIPLVEQGEIVNVITAVDTKLKVNKKLLAKQTELKKGLMQDLLSGVKRVSI